MASVLIICAILILFYGTKVAISMGDELSFSQILIISLLGPLITLVEIANFILSKTSVVFISFYVGVPVPDNNDKESP